MLHLLQPTPRSWAQAAADDVDSLLADHAHCELKAAQSALSLVARFGAEHALLVEPLSALAREETQHFRMVFERIQARDGDVGTPSRDEYVRALQAAARQDAEQPLLDRLLVCALIEARSCERFKVLSEELPDGELAGFYRGLMASEARHFTLFAGLAERIFGAPARVRLTTLAQREAAVARHLPLGPTVHG